MRSNMLVCLLSYLFLLLSDHSTELCRGALGNLNEKLLLTARMCAGGLSSFTCQQVSKRTLFDHNFRCSDHFSAVKFGSINVVNYLEIIFASCEFLSLLNTTCHRLSADRDVQRFRTVFLVIWRLEKTGCRTAWRNLAGLGAIGRVRWWWQCGLRKKCNRSPDAQLGIFWLGRGNCSTSIHKNRNPFLRSLVRIFMIDVPIA